MGKFWKPATVRGAILSAVILSANFCGGLLAFASPAGATCPNEAFREGASVSLPDCRAYELVTPTDANGRKFNDITTINGTYDLFPMEPASPLLDSFVFSTVAAPLRTPSGGDGLFDSYQAVRSAAGWGINRRLTPSGAESVYPYPGSVSPDHAYAFMHVQQFDNGESEAGSLAREGEADYLGKPDGTFQLTGIGSLGVEPLAQGRYISPGGQHVIFSTGRLETQSKWCAIVGPSCKVRRLEPKAAPTGTAAVYDREADGPTRVISLLPGDVTPAEGEAAFYQGASADGTAVAFKIGGILYVRLRNLETQEVAAGNPTYGGISNDGTYVFYVSGGDIHRYDTDIEQDEAINSSGDAQMTNVSADGSHVYFVSPSQLDGVAGVAGEPNLYDWSGGAPEFVATLAESDLESTSGGRPLYPNLVNWTDWVVSPYQNLAGGGNGPGNDSSRTTPDGSAIVFESRRQLTSYPNASHTEIYRYSALDKSLSCASCNPLQPSASEDAQLQNLAMAHAPTIIHNVSIDGTRVFFETPEALVEGDTDGINDIYEWHLSPGSANPTVALITSGHSAKYAYPPYLGEAALQPNTLLGITPDGSDVFFASQDVLVPGAAEGGAFAIYDARIGGGFLLPQMPVPCGDSAACRPATSPTVAVPAATSEGRRQQGNVKPRRRCRKKKRRHHHAAKHRSHEATQRICRRGSR